MELKETTINNHFGTIRKTFSIGRVLNRMEREIFFDAIASAPEVEECELYSYTGEMLNQANFFVAGNECEICFDFKDDLDVLIKQTDDFPYETLIENALGKV